MNNQLTPTATNSYAPAVTPATIAIHEYRKDYNDIHYNDFYDQLQLKHLKTDAQVVTKPYMPESLNANQTVGQDYSRNQFENFDFSQLVETSSILTMITAMIMIAMS